MPRYARDDDGDIYRVVVTTTWSYTDDREGSSSTQNYGPYQTLQAAKVQRTTVKWEDA